MAYRNFKILLFILTVTTFYKCGKGAACAGESYFIDQADLVLLSPLQNIYNEGDEVTVKVTIPPALSKTILDISANTVGNYKFSRNTNPDSNIFAGNTLSLIKGSTINPLDIGFEMPINFFTGSYELEFKVKLNRLGNYSISSRKGAEPISFKGPDECRTVTIQTNKVNPNNTDEIIFTVI